MTFDFRSVPRCGKLAVTFFPGLVEPSLRHFLEEQGITGWSIISKRDALARFPDTKVPEDIRLYPGSPRVETQVRCLVSYRDPDAMYAEILKVNDSPENKDWLAGLSNQYFKEEECAMEDQHPDPAPAQPLPWYDDRVEAVRKEYVNPWAEEDEPEPEQYDTPKAIYGYLDRLVWKQDAAKKAAAVIAFNTFKRGIKSNALFIGPSGTGKTHIWRCLQELYPHRIVIVDASRLTKEGWSGSIKWSDLLRDPILQTGAPAILVMDEADKFLLPCHTSHGDNIAHAVASEGLKILEGSLVEVKERKDSFTLDTSRISFVCCGAFSDMASQRAKDRQKIGFGAPAARPSAYDRPITERDLLDCGVMPEFLGRIQRIVNLEPMTADDFFHLLDSDAGPVERLQRRYGVQIHLSAPRRRELAEQAASSGLGVRSMESRLRQLLDDALFEDCAQASLTF